MSELSQATFYSGKSMRGTFLPGDWLIFERIPFSSIKRGDILTFFDKTEKRLVHRVIQINTKGIVTQGDNNLSPDADFLIKESMIGRVIDFERNGKFHKVWNGKLGLVRAWVLHERLHFICGAKFFLKKPYRMIKKTGIVVKFWHPKIATIIFETPDGSLVKYIHKGKTVASCWTNTNRWWFKRPYDFVIDPKRKQ